MMRVKINNFNFNQKVRHKELILGEYSGGSNIELSNTEQVWYSDGPWSFGLGPNHSKLEHSKWPL